MVRLVDAGVRAIDAASASAKTASTPSVAAVDSSVGEGFSTAGGSIPGGPGVRDCCRPVKVAPAPGGRLPFRGQIRQFAAGIRIAPGRIVDTSTPLRFVEADRLDSPAGALRDIVLISPSDATLGRLDGVIVNPQDRQVCYYVVKSDGWIRSRRYLVPVAMSQLESERRALRVDVEPEDLPDLAEADPGSFPPFSDTDAVDAMFAPRVQ